MYSNISRTWSICILIAIGGLLFLTGVVVTHDQKGDVEVYRMSSGMPLHIRIPKILVDADIESVGMMKSGQVDSPKDPASVGWFNHSVFPGEKGTAVVDGHFGWIQNIPAVFDKLHILQKGDRIYVEDATGSVHVFEVQKIQMYSPDEYVTSVFVSPDEGTHLNLITCGGIWNTVTQDYSQRLVVFSDAIDVF